MENRFAQLRELLCCEPSAGAWEALLRFFFHWSSQELSSDILDYAASHLLAWNDELRILQTHAEYDDCVYDSSDYYNEPYFDEDESEDESGPTSSEFEEAATNASESGVLDALSEDEAEDERSLWQLFESEPSHPCWGLVRSLHIQLQAMQSEAFDILDDFSSLHVLHVDFSPVEWNSREAFQTSIDGDDLLAFEIQELRNEFLSLKNIKGIEKISSCKALRELHFHHFCLVSLEGFPEHPTCSKFFLDVHSPLLHLEPLEQWSSLEDLHIEGSRRIRNVKAITRCKKLRSIELTYSPHIWDGALFVGLDELAELSLIGASELESVDELEKLPSLHTINLSDCRALEDCKGLMELPLLKRLELPEQAMHWPYVTATSMHSRESVQKLQDAMKAIEW